MLFLADGECASSVSLSSGTKFYGEGKFVLDENVVTRGDVRLESGDSGGGIVLASYSEVKHGSYLAANGESWVRVGKFVHVAHFVSLKTSHHKIDVNGDCVAGDTIYNDISIGDGSWLCAGCTVIPGVTVGKKNVVAAGAVVTRNTDDGVLVAGVPALVKKRY